MGTPFTDFSKFTNDIHDDHCRPDFSPKSVPQPWMCMSSSLRLLALGAGLGAALGDVSGKAAGSTPGNTVDAAFVRLPGLHVGGSPASTGVRGGAAAVGALVGCPSRQPPRLSGGIAMSGSGDGEMKLHGAASDYLKKIPSHLQGIAIRNVKVDLGSKREGKGKIEYKGDGTPSLIDIQAEIDEEDEREYSEIAMNMLDDLEVDVSNFDGVGALFHPCATASLAHFCLCLFLSSSSHDLASSTGSTHPNWEICSLRPRLHPNLHLCIGTRRGSSHSLSRSVCLPWQDIEDANFLKNLKETMHPDDFKMLFRNVGELL
jgi:hypothetical protein